MDEDLKNVIRHHMNGEFLPEPSPDTLGQVDRRMTTATEYMAFHLGQIDVKLGRLIALLEARSDS